MQDVLIPNGILADFFDYWEKLFIIYVLDLWYNIFTNKNLLRMVGRRQTV